MEDANGDNRAFIKVKHSGKAIRMGINVNTPFVGTATNHDLALRVGGVNLMILKTDRNVGLSNNSPSHPLQVGTDSSNGNGAHVTAGGTWTNGSSRASKEGFERVDSAQVLARVAALPITRWRYRGSEEGEHLGPVAEDFHAAFGPGGDARYIATIDADGVALAAIQGLHALAEAQREELEVLRARLARLEEEGR